MQKVAIKVYLIWGAPGPFSARKELQFESGKKCDGHGEVKPIQLNTFFPKLIHFHIYADGVLSFHYYDMIAIAAHLPTHI